jgi:hypothetical protein
MKEQQLDCNTKNARRQPAAGMKKQETGGCKNV